MAETTTTKGAAKKRPSKPKKPPVSPGKGNGAPKGSAALETAEKAFGPLAKPKAEPKEEKRATVQLVPPAHKVKQADAAMSHIHSVLEADAAVVLAETNLREAQAEKREDIRDRWFDQMKDFREALKFAREQRLNVMKAARQMTLDFN